MKIGFHFHVEEGASRYLRDGFLEAGLDVSDPLPCICKYGERPLEHEVALVHPDGRGSCIGNLKRYVEEHPEYQFIIMDDYEDRRSARIGRHDNVMFTNGGHMEGILERFLSPKEVEKALEKFRGNLGAMPPIEYFPIREDDPGRS